MTEHISTVIFWCWAHHSPSHGEYDTCRLWVPHQEDEPVCDITPAVVMQAAFG